MFSETAKQTISEINPEDELEASNIAHMVPYKGMRLELRDMDYIWSSGYIVSVVREPGKVMVKVASDGWGREWDETMEWPNDRLAELYTYTKEVKCLLDLLRKKPKKGEKQKKSSVWPIRVQFRMPHPGVKHARTSLSLEDKIFCLPYRPNLLPADERSYMIHDGGCWFHNKRLRQWKTMEQLSATGEAFSENFTIAYCAAENDPIGKIAPKVLVENSLLHERFRVHNLAGCPDKDGALRDLEPPKKKGRLMLDGDDEGTRQSDGTDPDTYGRNKFPSVVSVIVEKEPVTIPPHLPPPIPIDAELYPNSGIRKCVESNQYVATVSRSGNAVMLGKFPTQTQAHRAILRATADPEDTSISQGPQDVKEAQIFDLQAISMESIIDAFDGNVNASEIHGKFDMHEWTLDSISFKFSEAKPSSSESIGVKESRKGHLPPTVHVRKSKRKNFPFQLGPGRKWKPMSRQQQNRIAEKSKLERAPMSPRLKRDLQQTSLSAAMTSSTPPQDPSLDATPLRTNVSSRKRKQNTTPSSRLPSTTQHRQSTPSSGKRREVSTTKLDYRYSKSPIQPRNFLDVSPQAIASTAPLTAFPLNDVTASFEFFNDVRLDCSSIRDLLDKWRSMDDVNERVIVSNLPPNMSRNQALNFYRNFCDSKEIGSIDETFITCTRREIDILAYALLQAERQVVVPGTKGLSSNGAWGKRAWELMSYRNDRKKIGDRLYIRNFSGAKPGLPDLISRYLKDEAYVSHLERTVKVLFDSLPPVPT